MTETGYRQLGANSDGSAGRTSRRAVLAGLGGTAAAALAGCLSGGSAGDGGGADSITVSVYGGAYGNVFEEYVAGPYEEETGTTVEVSKAWSKRVSKLRSAEQGGNDPPYDLIGLSGFNYLTAREEELVQPVRYGNVPNADMVWDFFKEYRTDEYGVPAEGGVLGIIYKEGVPHAESWADFKTIDRDAGMNGGYWKNPLIVSSLLAERADGIQELYDESMHDAVFAQLEQISENVSSWYTGGASVWEALDGGTIDYGAFYYASGLAGIDNRPEKDYRMALPEQSPGYYTNFCVTNTDKRAAAEDFLNYMLRTEVQTRWNENGYYIPANSEVAGNYVDRLQGLYPESDDELADFMLLGNSERLAPYQSMLSDRFARITST